MDLVYIPEFDDQPIKLVKNNSFTLGDIQDLVGGYLAKVPLERTDSMGLCDEEGLCKGLQFNTRASSLLTKMFRGNVVNLVGPFVIVGTQSADVVSVPDDMVRYVIDAFGRVES